MEDKVTLKIADIYVIAQALEVAIDKSVFTADEVKQFFNSWNTVIRFCEDVKRKTKIEELYKKTPIVEEVPKTSE